MGDWGKPTIPASAQLAAELPHAVSILIIPPCFSHLRASCVRLIACLHWRIKFSDGVLSENGVCKMQCSFVETLTSLNEDSLSDISWHKVNVCVIYVHFVSYCHMQSWSWPRSWSCHCWSWLQYCLAVALYVSLHTCICYITLLTLQCHHVYRVHRVRQVRCTDIQADTDALRALLAHLPGHSVIRFPCCLAFVSVIWYLYHGIVKVKR